MREPLLVPAAAIAAGIVLSHYVPFHWAEIVPRLAIALICSLAAYRRGSRGLGLAALLTASLFGGITLERLHRRPPPPELDAAPGEVVLLEGCVVEPPSLDEAREQFLVELAPRSRAQATLYLGEGQSAPGLSYGQRVEFPARVRAPRNFDNPGSFDYERYLFRRDIHWLASIPSGGEVRVLPGRCGSAALGFVFGLRTAALERIARFYTGDPYTTAVTQALLLGEQSRLERVWTENYRRTGTYHALVVSGLHVAVIAGVLLLFLRLLSLPPAAAYLLTAGTAWIYAVLCGWQPPVVRSAAGFSLFLIARWSFRQARVLNLLAAVGLVFLAADPEQLFEPSFQLSFLAVAVLGAFAGPMLEKTTDPLRRGLAGLHEVSRDLHLDPRTAQFRVELRLLAETVRLYTRLPRRLLLEAAAWTGRVLFHLWSLFAVSAVMQIGLALPMAFYFHRLSLSGLTANLLVVPVTSIAVQTGLLAVLTGWGWFAWITGSLISLARVIVDWHMRWEPLWRIPDPPAWLAVAIAAALLAVCFSKHWVPAAVLVALAAVLCVHPFPPKLEPGTLELTAIDVGQGESLFMGLPEGRALIVDGGGIPLYGKRRKPRLDIGEDVVSAYLFTRSIRRIDVLVSTHQHDDHAGGLPALMDNFRPRELWTGATPPSPVSESLFAKAAAQGVYVRRLRRGDGFRFGGASFEVLAPFEDYEPRGEPANNDSLVLRVTFGAHSFLLTGDIEHRVEARLAGDIRPAHVLKLAHHGSRTSTTSAFLDAVQPAFALVSSGYQNLFLHPHPSVLGRLEERHVRVLRTDRNGLVTLRTDGRRFTVREQRPGR